SLKAGGVGLNLTAADYVIHIDPWWNPAVEQQASDRTHRIGQTKPVFVYKFPARDTVEEKIVLLQEKKKALVDSIIQTEQSLFKSLTRDDISALFS
ncbi:MAG: C-terminal helicase domain-containing protein, partial [Armatimonadetes bacterium]|nr:C-terminal helicase domain-containing protein [Armatimonadota bacterium]